MSCQDISSASKLTGIIGQGLPGTIDPKLYPSLGFYQAGIDAPALPPAGTSFLQAIISSCTECVAANKDKIEVSRDKLEAYLLDMDWERFKRIESYTNTWVRALPLKFSNQLSEANFIILRDLLQLGSGYRNELKASNGGRRGAFETILYGCMSMYLAGNAMDATSYEKVSLESISEHFQIPMMGMEEPIQAEREDGTKVEFASAITISRPSVLRRLVEQITVLVQDTGRRLRELGYKSMAHFVIDQLERQQDGPSAGALVEAFACNFPAFQDVGEVGGRPVYLFKKAQLVVYDLWLRFGEEDPKRFGFKDIGEFTIFADNVIPTMQIHHGLIRVKDEELQRKLDEQRDLNREDATLLRATAVVVAKEIVELIRSNPGLSDDGRKELSQANFDQYWWQEGKEPELRKLPRFSFKNTVYF